jgi:hypothetical protein
VISSWQHEDEARGRRERSAVLRKPINVITRNLEVKKEEAEEEEEEEGEEDE